MSSNTAVENENTSVDLLWKKAINEIDAWNEREAQREAAYIKSVESLITDAKRRKENTEELIKHLTDKQKEWERKTREELLTATTAFQYIFPVKSYEDINRILEDIQKRTIGLFSFPQRLLINDKSFDRLLGAVKKYIDLRKANRNQYVKQMKELSSVIQENQRNMIQLYTQQVKNLLFPLQKYIEQSSKFMEKEKGDSKAE